MASIRKLIDVDASPEAVWEKIADVGSISKLIGYIKNSKLEGDKLICELGNGARLVEQLISVDEENRRVVLSIVESPVALDFHVAVMELEDVGGGTRLIWTIDVLPAEAAKQMNAMLDSAVVDMERTLLE